MNDLLAPLTTEFLLTATIVVLIPGTGVIYTLSTALLSGFRASVAAAIGCTLGIVPHLLASLFGLAALLHASAVAFQTLKWVGIAYLLYLAWGMWRQSGAITLDSGSADEGGSAKGSSSLRATALRGILINILNPKLSIFFLAFLPQFVEAGAPDALAQMEVLSLSFMALTFFVFVGYGLGADRLRRHVLGSATLQRWMQRCFAMAFAGFAARLALSER